MIMIDRIVLSAQCNRCGRIERVTIKPEETLSKYEHRYLLTYTDAIYEYERLNKDMIFENNEDYPDSWVCRSCLDNEEAQNSIPTLQSLNPGLSRGY